MKMFPVIRSSRRNSIVRKEEPAFSNVIALSLRTATHLRLDFRSSSRNTRFWFIKKGFLGKLRWETDTIPLPEIANGVYQAPYDNTRVTGLYTVEYLINGNVPITCTFFRTASHSKPVLFGKPDRPKSNFYLFDESGAYFLNLKPVDIYGNYLGMGKADQISITMSVGSTSQPLDYLDGRYV